MQKAASPTIKTNGSVKSKTISPVLMTTNYGIFKIMADNRNLNLLHVNRLVESYHENHLICPIIVNERYEVIDGQHRLEASKETGLPVYYIIVSGYGIKEVQVFNTNQKNWTKMDFLSMYCANGKKAYLELKQFMTDFPDFQIQSAERIITGKTRGTNSTAKRMKDFEDGKLTIPNISKSYSNARKIMDFKPHYKNFNRGTFVSCLLPLLASKVYDHKEMMHKLSNCPIKLEDCDKVESYRMLLEDIYNYKRQKENKVSFRYQ